jgi:hypothetical protein
MQLKNSNGIDDCMISNDDNSRAVSPEYCRMHIETII